MEEISPAIINEIDQSRQIGPYIFSIVIAEYVLMSVWVFYQYGYKRVRQLQNKSFHQTMLLIIVGIVITSVVSGSLGLAWMLEIQETKVLELVLNPPFGWLYHSYLVLFNIEMALDFTLHCIFVVKYWVAGQKVQMCMTTRIDPNFDFKVKVLFFSLLIWIYASLGVGVFAFCNPENKGIGWFSERMVWLGLAVSFPAFLFFILQAHAFETMKNFTLRETEQAISKTQVWLQLGSSFVFAAGMFAPFCAKPLSPAWLWCYFTAVTVGVVSLGVLVRTLIQICDLQLRHELLEHENHISTNQSSEITGDQRMSFVGSEEDKLDVSYLKVDEASIIKHSMRVRVKVHLSHSSHF